MSTPSASLSLLIGATGGLGSAVCAHLLNKTPNTVIATCRKETASLTTMKATYPTRLHVIPSVDLLSDDPAGPIISFLKSQTLPISRIYIVAGLLVPDTLSEPDVKATMDMYRVCAVGPLVIASALNNSGFLREGCKLGIVTSEGGSIGLRTLKEGAGSYGHHMSKAANNMLGKLLAIDLHPKGVPVVCIHPGFIRTRMTEHYSDSYDDLGAVEPEVAADGVVRAVEEATLENTGKFVAPLGGKSLGFGIYAIKGDLQPMGELPW